MKGGLHPPNTGNKVIRPLSQSLFNTVLKFLATTIKQEKKKGHVDCKKEIKGSLFADAVTAYIENLEASTKRKKKTYN